MDDRTIKFIYYLKNNKNKRASLEDIASDFLVEDCGIPIEYCSKNDVYEMVVEFFLDYIIHCANLEGQLRAYFFNMSPRRVAPCNDFQAMLKTLRASQVKNRQGDYINGFRDIE